MTDFTKGRLSGGEAVYEFEMPVGDVTVEAAFAPRKYRIEFVDGSYQLDTMYLELGETPDTRAMEMETWGKSASSGAPFIGWEPAIGPVTGDTVYTMVYGEASQELYHISATDEAIKASLFISPPLGRTVTDSNIHAGLKVVLSARVEDGKGIESWSVIDADGDPVALDTDEYGFPCFTMPESDVTVSATYTDNVLPVHLPDGLNNLIGSDVNGALLTSLSGTLREPYAAPGETVTMLFVDSNNTGITVTVTPTAGEPFTVSSVPASAVVMNMQFGIISFTMPDSPVSVSAEQQSSHVDLPELALGINEIDNRRQWYSFTPAKTGAYSFKALDDNGWRAYVYDEDGNEVDSFSSDSPAATLVAGERYLLQSNVYSYSLSLTYIMIEEPSEEAVLYPITVEEVLHGRVVPTVDEAPEGYQVTLTFIPDPGYRLSGVSPEVTCSGVSLDLVACNRDRYYFNMPAGAVTVAPPEFVPVDYALTVEAEMGTATALVNGEPAETAHCGDTVILEMEPAYSPFTVPNVYVNGVRLKAQDGAYSFIMPAGNVNIHVEFRDAEYYDIHITQSAHGTVSASWYVLGYAIIDAVGEAPVDSQVFLSAADVEDGWAVSSWSVYTADGPIYPEKGIFVMPEAEVWIEATFSEAREVSFQIDAKALAHGDYWQWIAGGAWSTETGGYAAAGTEVIIPLSKNAPCTGRKPVFTVTTASGTNVPYTEEEARYLNEDCWAAIFTMPDEPVIVTIDTVMMDMDALHLGENSLILEKGLTNYTFTPEESGVYRFANTGGYFASLMTLYDTGVIGGSSAARLLAGETCILPVGRTDSMSLEVTVTITRVGDIETNAVTIADDIEYGSVEATVSEAPAGHYVQLKAVPAGSSELVSISASWEGGDINLSPVEGEELTFSFSMPPGDVTINASFSVPHIETPAFTDPEGREIEDQALVEWLSANNFTQSDINALGSDAAATDKLYECWLLNCSITAENPGGALSITGFAVSNDQVFVTVQLVRQSPLGYINGALYLYGANDLSVGFGDRPISNEIVNFRDGDSTFAIDPTTAPASGTVTQTVTAIFDASLVSEKFFKATIELAHSEEP